MIDDGPGRDFRWVLFTADAHGLYEQFGFAEPGRTAMVRPTAMRADATSAQRCALLAHPHVDDDRRALEAVDLAQASLDEPAVARVEEARS